MITVGDCCNFDLRARLMNRLCQLVPINLPTIARSIHTSIFFHLLKKSTFELFYKYFLQYDHLIMLESSVTMKSDGMHISRPACSPSWRISNATTSYMVFL